MTTSPFTAFSFSGSILDSSPLKDTTHTVSSAYLLDSPQSHSASALQFCSPTRAPQVTAFMWQSKRPKVEDSEVSKSFIWEIFFCIKTEKYTRTQFNYSLKPLQVNAVLIHFLLCMKWVLEKNKLATLLFFWHHRVVGYGFCRSLQEFLYFLAMVKMWSEYHKSHTNRYIWLCYCFLINSAHTQFFTKWRNSIKRRRICFGKVCTERCNEVKGHRYHYPVTTQNQNYNLNHDFFLGGGTIDLEYPCFGNGKDLVLDARFLLYI